MANPEHLTFIKQGIQEWNKYWDTHMSERPDLSGADLRGINLEGVNLVAANLSGTNFKGTSLRGAALGGSNLAGANLSECDLAWSDLAGANLVNANLSKTLLVRADLTRARLTNAILTEARLHLATFKETDLSGTDLSGCNLEGSDLSGANLSNANLTKANLTNCILVKTNLSSAKLIECNIFGISAWEVNLQDTIQKDLVITDKGQPTITVDDLEVAQFIYILLNNKKIRQVIDTITSKVVLILGRFTPARKLVLDSLRVELGKRNYLPVVFDFDKPINRDLTETISTIAHISRFVIADITDAKSIPQELQSIVPHLPSVPIQPIIESAYYEYGMFEHFKRYPWVLDVYQYKDIDELIKNISDHVIVPSETKLREIMP